MKKGPLWKFVIHYNLLYSKASRYTASSCTDLDNARFWIGSKNIWDAHFLNCYLRCTFLNRVQKKFEMHVFIVNCYLRCTFFWDHKFWWIFSCSCIFTRIFMPQYLILSQRAVIRTGHKCQILPNENCLKLMLNISIWK